MKWTIKTTEFEIEFTKKPTNADIYSALKAKAPSLTFNWVDLVSPKGVVTSIQVKKPKANSTHHPLILAIGQGFAAVCKKHSINNYK